MSNIIKVKDSNGNWIGIPALQGEPGITPHIGENGNWFIGEEDTGVKANIDLTPYATTEEVNQAINAIDIPANTSDLTNDSGFITKAVDNLDNYYKKTEIDTAISEIKIPTKVSELTNDSGFLTNTVDNLTNYYKKSEIYTQAEVNNLINSITTLNIEVVSTLPTSNISSTTIYLKGSETAGTNDYEEWLYINGGWELIGTTAIDLSPYATKTYVGEQIAGVTKSSLGLGNVENKSSATIRGELTSANVTTALGYAPLKDAYTLPVATSSTLGGVKSGTDITVDANGNVSVNNNSHTHTVANISDLTVTAAELNYIDGVTSNIQTQLNAKAVNKTLTNEDLNNVKTPGFYNAGGGNSVTNKPSGVEHFGMEVIHYASGEYYVQIVYNNSGSYRRKCDNGTWGSWVQDKLTDTTYTLNSFGVTATAAELNYVDGVTSNIQTQLNARATKTYVDNAVANAGSGGSGVSNLTRTTNAYFGW